MSTEESTDKKMTLVPETEKAADKAAAPAAEQPAKDAAADAKAKPAKATARKADTAKEAKDAKGAKDASAKRSRATTRAEKPKRAPDPDLKRKVLIGLAIFAAVIVMLYRPTRDLYIAWRTGYTLNVRYEALAEENEELNDDLERLMTREGIEDAARERGFVLPGETSVKVEGLEEEPDTGPAKASDITGEENLPWYIKVGDAVFFYRTDKTDGVGQ